MPDQPISLPAGYAPAFAIGYSGDNGQLAVVDDSKPLPVTFSTTAPLAVQQVGGPAPAALEGETAADMLVGPFVPATGRAVMLTLSGTWEGSVQVERSTDGGTSRHPLTAAGSAWANFGSNACEAIWAEDEEGVELYLDIAIASGTLAYRIAQ